MFCEISYFINLWTIKDIYFTLISLIVTFELESCEEPQADIFQITLMVSNTQRLRSRTSVVYSLLLSFSCGGVSEERENTISVRR